MQQINCLIIEDEPLAAEILEDYIQKIPHLNLIKWCSDAISANQFLQIHKIDLIFLDIHLPVLKGLDFLKTLKSSPKVIITTAFRDYALMSYDFNVIDYLLKPIEFSRFLTAINKLNIEEKPLEKKANTNEKIDDYLFFNVNKKMIKVFVNNILYVESKKEYVEINTKEKKIITKISLSEIETKLNSADFIKIHRSFIIAKNKIEAFTQHDVEIAGKLIPIGRSYKEMVQNKFGFF